MVLYGPLCMNIDVVRESVNLPVLHKGDHVVVHKVGAYNMTQWMQFIQMRPKVVLIDMKGETHIIRQHETIETLNSLEEMPAHLKDFNLQPRMMSRQGAIQLLVAAPIVQHSPIYLPYESYL